MMMMMMMRESRCQVVVAEAIKLCSYLDARLAFDDVTSDVSGDVTFDVSVAAWTGPWQRWSGILRRRVWVRFSAADSWLRCAHRCAHWRWRRRVPGECKLYEGDSSTAGLRLDHDRPTTRLVRLRHTDQLRRRLKLQTRQHVRPTDIQTDHVLLATTEIWATNCQPSTTFCWAFLRRHTRHLATEHNQLPSNGILDDYTIGAVICLEMCTTIESTRNSQQPTTTTLRTVINE